MRSYPGTIYQCEGCLRSCIAIHKGQTICPMCAMNFQYPERLDEDVKEDADDNDRQVS